VGNSPPGWLWSSVSGSSPTSLRFVVMSSTPEPTEPRGRRSWLTFGGMRAQILVGVLLAALGFATVVQVRLTHNDDDFAGQRRDDLIELLDSLSAASDRTRTQLETLQQTRDDLLSSSQRRQAAIDEANQRLEVLRILAGTVPAEGPGVTVTIDDPDSAITASTLLNGIEELRDAGAEAIEINDSVRVVASTSFTETDGVISADGVELRPPYVIDVIGSSHTLSEAVVFRGGLSDEVAQLGGTTDVRQKDVVEVGSLHTLDEPEYSQPTTG
jgi:uncharacterized protein YlxW (UPF0749 family)